MKGGIHRLLLLLLLLCTLSAVFLSFERCSVEKGLSLQQKRANNVKGKRSAASPPLSEPPPQPQPPAIVAAVPELDLPVMDKATFEHLAEFRNLCFKNLTDGFPRNANSKHYETSSKETSAQRCPCIPSTVRK